MAIAGASRQLEGAAEHTIRFFPLPVVLPGDRCENRPRGAGVRIDVERPLGRSGSNGVGGSVFCACPRIARALCSVTVSVLRRLLGRDVVRTERFQEGNGRCVCKVLPESQVEGESALFDWEPESGPSDEPG